MQDKKARESPPEITVNGKKYINLKAAAERIDVSYNTIVRRVNKGHIEGAIELRPDNFNQLVTYIPADTQLLPGCMKGHRLKRTKKAQPKGAFPERHRDFEGVPVPTVINKEAQSVLCADCPHVADKRHKCLGLTHYSTTDASDEFYACHRIGYKVIPVADWINANVEGGHA